MCLPGHMSEPLIQSHKMDRNVARPVAYTDIFAIPLDGRHLIYAPLKKMAFYCEQPVKDYLAQLMRGETIELSEDDRAGLEFISDLPLSLQAPARQLDGSNGSFKPCDVTLFLTTGCNLRCIYCYASAGAKKRIDMDLATAKRGIDFVHKNTLEKGQNYFSVGFHGGGEPTTNWKVLVEACEYAKNLAAGSGLEVRTSMATNGVFSDEKCRWIIENINEVNLSIDGIPEVQDIQRPAPSGGSSSAIVMKNIASFDKAGFPYGIRMTVTSYALDSLAESVQYLLENAHPGRIQAEPVYDLGRGQDTDLHVSTVAFLSAFKSARRIALDRGVELCYSAADINRLSNRFCQSCGDGFNLTPRGNVSACFEVCDEEVDLADEFLFGALDQGLDRYVFNLDKLQHLRGRTVENIAWCQGCYCKWHCAGDCQYQARLSSRHGEFTGSLRCEISRALILDQIIEKIDHSGGTIWIAGIEPGTI
jgi:uncharacterized protein